MITDNVKATGALTITKNGVVEREINNLVVTTGKELIASMLSGTGTAISHMAVGTGAVAAAAGDTTLGSELDRNAASTALSGATVTYSCTWNPGDGTGALTEAGLFNAASAGTMLARTVFAVVNKAADDTVTITWTVTIS